MQYPAFTTFPNTTVPYPVALQLEEGQSFFDYLEGQLASKLLFKGSDDTKDTLKAWLMLEIIAQDTLHPILAGLLEQETGLTASFQITGFVQVQLNNLPAPNLSQHLRACFSKDRVLKWLDDPLDTAGFNAYFKPYSNYKTCTAVVDEATLIKDLRAHHPSHPIVRAASNTSLHLKGRPVVFFRDTSEDLTDLNRESKPTHYIRVTKDHQYKTTRSNYEVVYSNINKSSLYRHFLSVLLLPDAARATATKEFVEHLFSSTQKQLDEFYDKFLHAYDVSYGSPSSSSTILSYTRMGVTIKLPCFKLTSYPASGGRLETEYSFLPHPKYPCIYWLKGSL